MGRPRNGAELTIAQLESILKDRRGQIDALERDRAKLLKELKGVDDKIKQLGGGRGGAASRPQNVQSLVETMQAVLAKAGKPLSVGEIVQAALDAGYRSSSDNFRGIVNQTLIKERKHFVNVDRGIYAAKK